ncbi:hypothetical protein AGABI2DRAFT_176882 [Agaricus bisporus var. bisporus H97]|uniref:hypothetical protein n=1 Tax=Agaricus bisporus var. bisporus (strain H97 / ATCC MYA-4626 / FGSC 10389) TaxID=936046 RepID=UPI00029F58D2|nr:hypothetical protein AGABI2DRAFT_176882 [Agaricus bisporus var. bisporus H97]EKV50569.1 hypothetical protein AGABI2DRAFT_176882 [Agaricus bisporus var. bisporus H97]
MSATITVRHLPKVAPLDIHHSRNSNLAGAPLPMIPRRMTRSRSLPVSSKPSSQPTSYDYEAQYAVDSDSPSSSTSESSRLFARRRRVGGVRMGALNLPEATQPLSQADQSQMVSQSQVVQAKIGDKTNTNDQSQRPLVYAPGMLRFSLEVMRSHMLAGPQTYRHNRSVSLNGSQSAQFVDEASRVIIRKKSGQPVKSSLKSSRSSTRGNLSVVTVGSSSKSEPPTPKVVHFDTKLEHVKHFIAEQKPLAVSRDGSPTDDTSGTDSDFPFTYGDGSGACRNRKRLIMRHINGTPKSNSCADVALEDYYLNFDGTSILGKIRVRNIAYCKTVAIRFTFDSWQTTSEVVGRYVESINSQFDRFSFSIRLNDLLARIEGKTFMMAIRYSTNGQDFWDNNNHKDYVAAFTKAKAVPESRRSDDDDASDVENLRSRLEVVLQAKARDDVSRSLPKKALDSRKADPPTLNSGVALSSRYDFGISLRNPRTWNPSDVPLSTSPPQCTQPSLSRVRRSTVPPPSSIPWPEKMSSLKRLETLPGPLSIEESVPLGSPRDIREDRHFPAHPFPLKRDEDESSVRSRNHQRSYLENGLTSRKDGFPRIEAGMPESKSLELRQLPGHSTAHISSRCSSFPPLKISGSPLSCSPHSEFELPVSISDGHPRDLSQQSGLNMGESSGDSDLSTPSLSTPTSSRSPTPSPTLRKSSLPPLSENILYPDNPQPVSPGAHYKQFLNKFCFFTGSSDAIPELTTAEKLPPDGRMLTSHLGGLNASYPTGNVDDLPATLQSDSSASTPTVSTSRSATSVS